MTACPPTRSRLPAVAILAVAAMLLGCGGPTPSRAPSVAGSTSPSAASGASAGPLPIEGLLVAGRGALQVTTEAGTAPFDGPAGAVVEVVAARGFVVTVDAAGATEWSGPATNGARLWQTLHAPAADHANPRLVALSPDGATLALASGDLQAATFTLSMVDLASGAARSVEVARGLDGPPTWIGPSLIAVHAIRPDQISGFVAIDPATGALTELPSLGIALAANADGLRVALDDGQRRDVLVGDRSDLQAGQRDRMTRLPALSNGDVERLALSGDGARLAIVRRGDGASMIELFALADGTWRGGGAIEVPGDQAVSITWLR